MNEIKEPHLENPTFQQLYSTVVELGTEEGRQKYLRKIHEQLSDPVMREIGEFSREFSDVQDSLANERGYVLDENWPEYNRHYLKYEQARSDFVDRHGRETVDEYDRLISAQRSLTRKGRTELYGPAAFDLAQSIILTANNADATDRGHIFLQEVLFSRLVENLANKSGGKLLVHLKSANDEVLKVPLGMFASAASFSSWWGRDDGMGGKSPERFSGEAINRFTALDSKPPVVDDSTMVLLSDGNVLFITHNSHRVAAAIRRGDPYIEVSGLVTVRAIDTSEAELTQMLSVHRPNTYKVTDKV